MAVKSTGETDSIAIGGMFVVFLFSLSFFFQRLTARADESFIVARYSG